MNAKKKAKRMISGRVLKNIAAVILLLAAEAGLAYLGYTFYMTSFLKMDFRIILVAAVAVFMLGLIWLVRRYIINN